MVTVMEITRETIIGDILDIAPETAPFFFEIGMHCLGCPASRGETVEMACAVHGVDCDELLTKINTFLKNKELFFLPLRANCPKGKVLFF